MKINASHKVYIAVPIACVLAYLLFFAKLDALSPRSWKAAWDLAHIPLFIFFGFTIYIFKPGLQDKRFYTQALLLVLVGVLLGVTIEFLQTFVKRQISFQDVMRDILGVVIALLLFSKRIKLVSIYIRLCLFGAVGIVLIATSWKFIVASWDEYKAYRQFPTLSDFENERERDRWSGDAVYEIVDDVYMDGRSSLKVSPRTRRNSSVELKYFPNNWLGYHALIIHVFNPAAEPFPLAISIHDEQNRQNGYAYDDRYVKQFTVLSGWNEIRILIDDLLRAPKRRHMDITHMRGVRLYVSKPVIGQYFYLDYVHLER